MCIRSKCIVKYVNIIILHTIQAGYDILSRLLMGQLSVNKFMTGIKEQSAINAE